jgi:2-oxoglutarate ferredoxin oxidoreductase subunit alpha
LDICALQILYLEPFPKKVREILKNKKKIISVENNSTGQLCDVIREKTGILVEDKILKYDARPFLCDELKRDLKKGFGLK